MEKRRTRSTIRIEMLCEQNHFSPTVVYWKSKKILGRYRDIRNLPAINLRTEEEITDKTIKLIRQKFKKSFVDKKCAYTGSLDYILNDILSLEYADDVIEEVFERMSAMNFEVEEYRPLIEYNFLYPDEISDVEIMEEIGMSKTSYYRKKKDAINLFGIVLWNTMLERSSITMS